MTDNPCDNNRILVHYRVTADAATIEARAAAIAVEQSVEMPVTAIDAQHVLQDIVGQVRDITDRGDGSFDVRIALATATTGQRAGQLLNMLFGNTSIQSDTVLVDAGFPAGFSAAFGGPNLGIAGLRARVGAGGALTCSALKPQGLAPKDLARLAGRLAEGGLDYIKDDHGLADQAYSPFADRVAAVAAAVVDAAAKTGIATRYLPSLSGTLDDMRGQIAVARRAGLDGVLIAPMIVGVDSFVALKKENPDFAFMAHPTMAGVTKVAPSFHFGKLFRLFGADALVFPNYGGRFGYSPQECRTLAGFAMAPWEDMKASIVVPAGGMTAARVPEMLEFYGSDVMLLIGGALLAARERIAQETAAFVAAVKERH